jgi:hypothetical protein
LFKRDAKLLIQGSLLTSEQGSQVLDKLKLPYLEMERYVFDGVLLDAFKEVFGPNSPEIQQVMTSIKDKSCTKQFFHPSAMYKNIMSFDVPEHPYQGHNINVRVAGYYLRNLIRPVMLKRIPVYHGMDTSLVWSNKNASAGVLGLSPNGTSKEANEFQCIDVALRMESMLREGIPYERIKVPAQMFHRGQISNILDEYGNYSNAVSLKDRFVWGLDGGTCTFEAKYAMPVINYLMNNWYSYVGGDDLDMVQAKVRNHQAHKMYWTSLDFSKFDQTIPSWLIHLCFNIIREFYPRCYWNELNWIEYNFINTSVVCRPLDGTVGAQAFQKNHGIPSGSCFTQIIGSMCNMYMMLTYLSHLCKPNDIDTKLNYVQRQLSMSRRLVDRPTMLVMGDDNLIFTDDKLDISDVAGYVYNMFGVRIHCEDDKDVKQGNKWDDPEFLKVTWTRRGRWCSPVYVMVNSIHNERERTYDNYSAWHIIYGLWLRSPLAFPLDLNEGYFLRKMQENGGIEQLRTMDIYELPGALRGWGPRPGERLYQRARAGLELLSRSA